MKINTMKVGLMIDTETLSLEPNALPWEIGMVLFKYDMLMPENGADTIDEWHGTLDVPHNREKDFHVSRSTWNWTEANRNDDMWLNFKNNCSSNGFNPAQLYDLISDLCMQYTMSEIWFRNSSFDVPVLNNFMGKLPWHRRQQCDVYTEINGVTHNPLMFSVERTGQHHNALDDARTQVAEVMQAKKLRKMMFQK